MLSLKSPKFISRQFFPHQQELVLLPAQIIPGFCFHSKNKLTNEGFGGWDVEVFGDIWSSFLLPQSSLQVLPGGFQQGFYEGENPNI